MDVLLQSNSIHEQIRETYIVQILSLLQTSEDDLSVTSLQLLTEPTVNSLLRSVSLICTSAAKMFHHFFDEGSGEFECLAVLCRQHWNEFCAKVPKDYVHLKESLYQVHSLNDRGNKLIWKTAKEIHQSLHGIFSELLGSQDFLTAIDTTFSEKLMNGQYFRSIITYWLPIITWLIQILQAIKCGHINVGNLKDPVLTLASTYRKVIVDNAEKIATILGLDSLEGILELIPKTNTTLTGMCDKATKATITTVNQSVIGLLCGTCFVLLIQATMSNSSQTEIQRLKLVLPRFRKF